MTSCFCIRKLSTIEFEYDNIPKLDMTYKSPEWDPGDPDWATQEASTMDSRGRVHDLDEVIAGGRQFINLVSASEQAADFTSDEYFHSALQARVNILRMKVGNSPHAIGHKLLQRLLEAPWKGRPSGVCDWKPPNCLLGFDWFTASARWYQLSSMILDRRWMFLIFQPPSG
jgi:hypothetical protein